MATKKESWNDSAQLETDLAWTSASLSAVQTAAGKFDIFDTKAREGVIDNRARIDDIKDIIAGGVNFRGKTTVAIADGATTKSISMAGGKTLVVEDGKAGDMVIVPSTVTGKEDREFIWDGEKWNEFGNASNLKALAFANQTSATYTPAGTIALTTEDATASLANGAATFSEVSVAATVAIDTYTPAGTISCGDYTPAGSVTVNEVTGVKGSVTVNEVSSAAFTGEAKTLTADFTGSETTLTASMTAGSISNGTTAATLPALPTLSASAPTVTVTPSTADVLATATVTNGVLSFGSSTVLTGASAALDAAPAVGYNSAYDTSLTGTITGGTVAGDSTVTYQPAGTITVETYTPTGSVSVAKETKTPEVSVNAFQPTASFSGSAAALKADFAGTAKAPTGTVTTTKFTPEATSITGTVTIADVPTGATFSGTAATITGNPA